MKIDKNVSSLLFCRLLWFHDSPEKGDVEDKKVQICDLLQLSLKLVPSFVRTYVCT
jgi:hypothetical protein